MLGLAVPAVGNWVGWPVWKHQSVGQLSCLTRESLLGSSAMGEEGDEKWMKPLCWIKPEMLFGEKNVPGLNSSPFIHDSTHVVNQPEESYFHILNCCKNLSNFLILQIKPQHYVKLCMWNFNAHCGNGADSRGGLLTLFECTTIA